VITISGFHCTLQKCHFRTYNIRCWDHAGVHLYFFLYCLWRYHNTNSKMSLICHCIICNSLEKLTISRKTDTKCNSLTSLEIWNIWQLLQGIQSICTTLIYNNEIINYRSQSYIEILSLKILTLLLTCRNQFLLLFRYYNDFLVLY